MKRAFKWSITNFKNLVTFKLFLTLKAEVDLFTLKRCQNVLYEILSKKYLAVIKKTFTMRHRKNFQEVIYCIYGSSPRLNIYAFPD